MDLKKAVVSVLPEEVIASRIFVFRGKRVMLDEDLASLYGVSTKRLNEQVKRNEKRFPDNFMFRLASEEYQNLKSQFATSSLSRKNWGGRRTPPLAFTEHGVAMLSSVLNSEKAIQVNIQIIDTFIKLRELLSRHPDIRQLREKIEALESKYDKQFQVVFEHIKRLIEPPAKPKKEIGFHTRMQ